MGKVINVVDKVIKFEGKVGGQEPGGIGPGFRVENTACRVERSRCRV